MAIVRTGTVAVTNGSKNVVGTGVNWSSVLQGMLFYPGTSTVGAQSREGVGYVIESVNAAAGTLVLERAYAGSTGSNLLYQIDTTGYNGDPATLALVNSVRQTERLNALFPLLEGPSRQITLNKTTSSDVNRIQWSVGGTGAYVVEQSLVGGADLMRIASAADGVSYVDAIRVSRSNGNVGINDCTPTAPLTVNGAGRLGGISAGSSTLQISHSGVVSYVEAFDPVTTSTKRNIALAAFGGSVGVGTVPADLFHVAGTIRMSGSSPTMRWVGTGGGTNSRNWDMYSSAAGNFFQARAVSDDLATAALWLNVIRSGVAIAGIELSGETRPGTDNNRNLGAAGLRWGTVFAGTGTINTSDAREKTPVRTLTPAEIRAATALAREVGAFQFLDSVAAKGDAARVHVGLTVQRAIAIMEAEGLDPFAYAFICRDQWAATPAVVETDKGGVEREVMPARPAGDRLGFRADQLALFIARGQAARQDALEARIAALETA